ncbi:MAG: F0F1 ATP synthase subunit A [Planctomycetota bacterium]
MADPLLHIKDSYYFDVPRTFWRVNFDSPRDMADNVGEWVVRNDPDYQDWEADKFVQEIREIIGDVDGLDHAKDAWLHWQHADHKRHGRPFDQYVEDSLAELDAQAANWVSGLETKPADATKAYLAENADPQLLWMQSLRTGDEVTRQWNNARRDMNDSRELDLYLESPRGNWAEEKTKEINHHLSGKVFIPQPFCTLKNAYEREPGFAFGITRYMIIEVAVAIIMFLLFRWLAGKVQSGAAPVGKLWNLIESIVTFVKTDVVEKGIDPHESPKFMPLFWTIFFFILGCNLMGMIPWVGSPTAAFALTAFLAIVVFVVGTVLGVQKYGVIGYLKNLCPELGLPLYLAIGIVPMVWVIEFASLFIKHAILAIRLLANMVAGHLVLLGIMGLAFGIEAASSMSAGPWTALSITALLGTTVLSFMELFVAFLQAYVFTLLAALFVGAATHGH